jgi:ElaB/YqjD/DUF883 family membrane-anchored ribosome-binding protein
MDQATSTTAKAGEAAKDVAGEVGTQATRVVQEAATQVRSLAGQARDRLQEQTRAQTEDAARGLQTLGGQLRALSEGRPEDAGRAGELASQLADRVSRLGSRLEERGYQGVIQDVESFARQRPMVFLGLAAAAGFAVSRLAQAARGSNGQNGQSSPSSEVTTPTPAGRSVGSGSTLDLRAPAGSTVPLQPSVGDDLWTEDPWEGAP